MLVGMTLPTMVVDTGGRELLAWARRIDAGPYSSLAAGERISFHNPDLLATLAAAAAATERVSLLASLVVLPLHRPVLAAKQLATIDVLSDGRLVAGVGPGARDDDFRAAGVATDRRLTRLDEHVATVLRVWAQEVLPGVAAPIGPSPVRPGGPPLLAGATREQGLARAARWARGFMGFWFDPQAKKAVEAVDRADRLWSAAGREGPPYRLVTFWYSTGRDRTQLQDYAQRYLSLLGETASSAMTDAVTVDSAAALRDTLEGLSEARIDEAVLIPVTTDLAELDRVETVLAEVSGFEEAGPTHPLLREPELLADRTAASRAPAG